MVKIVANDSADCWFWLCTATEYPARRSHARRSRRRWTLRTWRGTRSALTTTSNFHVVGKKKFYDHLLKYDLLNVQPTADPWRRGPRPACAESSATPRSHL